MVVFNSLLVFRYFGFCCLCNFCICIFILKFVCWRCSTHFIKYWQILHPVIQWGMPSFSFTFFTSDTWRRQMLSFSIEHSLTLWKITQTKHKVAICPIDRKGPEACFPAGHRDRSHVAPWPRRVPAGASFNNKQACSVWPTPGSHPKRWPCISNDATKHNATPSHTPHTETRVKQIQGVIDNTGFSWLKVSPGGLTISSKHFKRRVTATAHLVYTKTLPAPFIHL